MYLDLKALLGVEPNPLAVLAGIWNLLVIDPLNSGALQEAADLQNHDMMSPLTSTLVCSPSSQHGSGYTS